MRKLAAVEVALLIATMAIGHANAYDEQNLETIEVTAYSNTASNPASLSAGSIGVPSYQSSGLNANSSLEQTAAKGVKCAQKYAPKQQTGITSFTAQYGWGLGNPITSLATSYNHVAPSGGYQELDGSTTQVNGRYISYIYNAGANNGIANLVNTLAHEWSHQNGSDETQAEADGTAAENAYKADNNGAKCQ